jgi:hypothetical protein
MTTTHVRVDDAKLVKLIADLARQGTPTRIVADGVEYGIFLEMGTVRMKQAYPTLTPAVESNRDALEKGMQQAGGDLTRVTTVVDKVAFDVLGKWQENIRQMPVGDHIGLIDTGAMINSTHVVEPGAGTFDYEVDLKVSR